MSLPSAKQDIIISIRPEHVENIINRTKNHEFRNYLLPVSVKRLWIYQTHPISSITHIATIGHAKKPGEICDPIGLRNDEFDQGKLQSIVKYGYEILKLEEFPEFYSLEVLKEKGWLKGPPQKYVYNLPEMLEATRDLYMRFLFETLSEETSQ